MGVIGGKKDWSRKVVCECRVHNSVKGEIWG